MIETCEILGQSVSQTKYSSVEIFSRWHRRRLAGFRDIVRVFVFCLYEKHAEVLTCGVALALDEFIRDCHMYFCTM